ncbi:hypothetical protein [Streptomyces scabiei]|uniref:hypothetical protein n=1 Tax=Streptomyces scabiei TaxID=1930 RepID=UPI0029AEC87E|nr:hypothetical protein [Streptomyces scabiei]MDX2794024.1 hypothetical protein [Streptomyces scabiei]
MKYTDRDGDTWETVGGAHLRCVRRADPLNYLTGGVMDRKECEKQYGPLRPVDGPDAVTVSAIRAELAVVLQEMADDAYSQYRWRTGVDEDICYRLHELFEAKAKELREETG